MPIESFAEVGPSETSVVVQRPDENQRDQHRADRLQREEQLQEGALLVPRPFILETHDGRLAERAYCAVRVSVCVAVCVSVRMAVRLTVCGWAGVGMWSRRSIRNFGKKSVGQLVRNSRGLEGNKRSTTNTLVQAAEELVAISRRTSGAVK